MNGNQARQLFQSALEDRLAGDQLRDFEAALAQDPALCAEFEAFADARANVADMDAWLRKAGASATRQVPLVPAGVAERISRAAVARKRGRLVRLAVAAVATAAAAAIALVLFLPGDKPVQPSPETPSGWPRAAQGGVTMIEDAIYASAPLQELNPAPGVTLLVAGGSLLHPIRPGLALVEGEVTVRLASGARFEVHVGNHRVSAQAPAEFVVRVQADAFPDFPPPEDTRMHRPELLARFGALAFAFTVTAASGNVDIRAEGPVATLGPGQAQTFQAGPPPAPKPPEPPKPEDAFKHLDKNGDGKLDDKEADKKLIEDFDDNKDGTVDLDEFKKHHKPPQPGPRPPKPEDLFKEKDKNNDGKLDDKEADKKMLEDFDDNNDGVIDLDEFKKHFRPMPPRPPHGPDGPPKGPGGPPPGPGGGPGPGPGGPPPGPGGPPPKGPR
ncbi:MAG: hypothetical protein HS108_00330 [Planctomycetes bacterium]|nr:hypothetical protein [Planctomycetota bacterium]